MSHTLLSTDISGNSSYHLYGNTTTSKFPSCLAALLERISFLQSLTLKLDNCDWSQRDPLLRSALLDLMHLSALQLINNRPLLLHESQNTLNLSTLTVQMNFPARLCRPSRTILSYPGSRNIPSWGRPLQPQ